MKRRQEAAEKAEQDRIRAEQEAKAALEAQAEEARRAERSGDQADAPGSPQREKESGKNRVFNFFCFISAFLELFHENEIISYIMFRQSSNKYRIKSKSRKRERLTRTKLSSR